MNIALIIDIAILLFLGITIFYAWRLSNYMKIFRDSRRDMELLLQSLDADIARAEKSVLGMRNAAEGAAMKLNETIRESKFLADELKFMNEAGDNLATRLEKLAEKNRQLVDLIENAGGVTPNAPYRKAAPAQPSAQTPAMHRDDTDRGDEDGERPLFSSSSFEGRAANQSETPAASAPQLGSQAERELYEALQRRKAGR